MDGNERALSRDRSARQSSLGISCGSPVDGIPWHCNRTAHQALFDLYDRMVGDVDIPVVLQEVAEVVCGDLDAERASIYLIDHSTDELESVAVIGNVTQTIRVPIRDSSLAGYCARSGKSFLVPDAYGDLSTIDPRLKFDSSWDQRNGFVTRDVMCVPAMFKGELMGVVQVINSQKGKFGPDDLMALETISRLVGYSLYHAKLFDDLSTMKHLEKEKAEFMRIMVHELKSPVAAARMLSGVINQHQHVHPEIADISGRVSGRLDQLIEMIQELLHLAKVKSGSPLGEIGVIDLAFLTREVCATYEEQAAGKGLEMTVEVPEGPVEVRFDPQGYRLAISNLVSNAVKYTAKGRVGVKLISDAGWAEISVQDTGMGIPEADVPKLFREFFRASNAKKQGIQGTGVGLAGAKAIVERFGGQFLLDTEENIGSVFTIRLPLHVAS